MFKKYSILFTFLFSILSLFSDFSIGEPNSGFDSLMEGKTEHCLEVFNKLKSTKGILPDQAPFFHLVRTLPNPNFAIAMADGSSIYLDEASYDECQKMGAEVDNGLAFILAHELAHFTRHHIERHRFEEEDKIHQKAEIFGLMENDDSIDDAREMAKNIEEINLKYEIRKNEAEADLEAGFMSYLAGYKSLDAGGQFLDRAYERFGLKKEGGNYASLSERKAIVRNATLQLDSLIQVFEAANFAAVVGDEELAMEGYNYVSEKFSSARLHNNLGVHELFKLSRNYDQGSIPWEFPLTLDVELGESDGMATFTDDEEEMKRIEQRRIADYKGKINSINKAIAHFDKAIQLNQTYHSAYINKSIAYFFKYVIEGNFQFDSEFLEDELVYGIAEALRARKILSSVSEPNNKALSDVYNVMGIFAFYLRGKEEANGLFEIAEELLPNRFMTFANQQATIEGNAGGLFITDRIFIDESEDANTETNIVNINDEGRLVSSKPIEEKLFDKFSIIELVEKETDKWDTERIIGIENPNSMLPIKRILKYSNRKDHQFYSWEKRKGKSRVLKSLSFFSPKSNYNHLTSLGIKKADSKELLQEKYGTPEDILETPTSTLFNYNSSLNDSGIVFIMKEGQVFNWIVWEKTFD